MFHIVPRTAMSNRVSVVVPALNEAKTIGSVVAFGLRSGVVDEVIVIDDGSIDGTPEIAKAAGAKVMTSTMLGKGGSMEDGMRIARNETLLFLDGDLAGLRDDLVEEMTARIRVGEIDFAKARFRRRAGRVTALTAKPLLKTFFPELAKFQQPLSGIIAARRSLLERLPFENDYGVDVGLLIDAAMTDARLCEVDIGEVEHASHPLGVLEAMANEVARTILNRAAHYGRLRCSYVENIREAERQQRAHLGQILNRLDGAERVALFDMDGVLLKGRFIVELANHTGRLEALRQFLDNRRFSPEKRSEKIARLFAGLPRHVFEQVATDLPLTRGAVETVVGLRKAGFRVGIVTDSYDIVAEIVRRRVFADFCCAHRMNFRNGKATGRLSPSEAMEHPNGCKRHRYCKVNVLHHLSDNLDIDSSDVLAVGDGENDVCLLAAVANSVAFEPKAPDVRAAASRVVCDDLTAVIDGPSAGEEAPEEHICI